MLPLLKNFLETNGKVKWESYCTIPPMHEYVVKNDNYNLEKIHAY